MTRRGSLAYYLAAWVCGCFFMSATVWLEGLPVPTARSVSDLLFVYFLSLMYGAVPALLFAFLLRRAARRMRCNRAWQWIAGGAILAPALTELFRRFASTDAWQVGGWRSWISVSLLSSSAIYANRSGMALITAPAGAATAWVLFRVDRAFAAGSGDPQER